MHRCCRCDSTKLWAVITDMLNSNVKIQLSKVLLSPECSGELEVRDIKWSSQDEAFIRPVHLGSQYFRGGSIVESINTRAATITLP